MRTRIISSMLAAAFALAATATLFSQAAPAGQGARGGARGGAAAAAAPSAPAPAKDLTGVWMMRNPPGKNGPWTNYTYTDPMKNPPSMTAWGEILGISSEKNRKVKSERNQGARRLDAGALGSLVSFAFDVSVFIKITLAPRLRA